MLRRLLPGLMTVAMLAAAAPAAGQADTADWDGDYGGEPPELRSDVALGLTAGPALGVAGGWLNKSGQLGDPAQEQSTGAGLGTLGAVWLGVAFNDYFTFALGYQMAELSGDGKTAAGGAGVVRLEAFPLMARGGLWQNAGLSATFGIGVMDILRDEDDQKVAEGGALSVIGLGAHHELFRLGHLTLGPTLDYLHMYSQSLTVHAWSLGLRAAFYTGP